MRRLLQLVVLCGMICSVAWGQEPKLQQPKLVAPPRIVAKPLRQSYIVQLTEFRLKDAENPRMSAEEIIQSYQQLSKEGELDIVETVRLTALERNKSMVQVGRRVTVTTGEVSIGPGRGTARQTRQEMIGTMVTVMAEPQEGKVLLELAYESSRLEQTDGNEDPRDTVTRQFQTSLLLEAGQPKLVGGSSADDSVYLMVEVGLGE